MRYFKQIGMTLLVSSAVFLLDAVFGLLLGTTDPLYPWTHWQEVVWCGVFAVLTLGLHFLAGWRFGRSLQSGGWWIQTGTLLVLAAMAIVGNNDAVYMIGAIFNRVFTYLSQILWQIDPAQGAGIWAQGAAAVLSALLPTGAMLLGAKAGKNTGKIKKEAKPCAISSSPG